MAHAVIRSVMLLVCVCSGLVAEAAQLEHDRVPASVGRMWHDLLAGADGLHLPTTFLKVMPPDFIRFEFDDLRTYAAEYHPGEHRMVLNRSLSFNAAGSTLRPLAKMTSKEIEVLFHELFHAFIDWLVSREQDPSPAAGPLLAFARAQQACRYQEVTITPVLQRAHETEVRYLTEGEAWEALNETWAVFIGWAVWNQLELQRKSGDSVWQQPRQMRLWQERLEQALQKGELRGYYVPEDSDERRIAQKRFLAPAAQISIDEVTTLMRQVLGLPDEFIAQSKKRVDRIPKASKKDACEKLSG